MPFKVFISHKKEDATAAATVAARLQQNGIDTYVDIFDAEAKDGPDLADYLRDKLKTCHGLMAVVTRNTTESWWVPWEIGVASERNMPLATYSSDSSQVPTYLKKWPYITRLDQVDEYAKLAKSTVSIRKRALNESASVTGAAERISGSDFNRALKKALGQ
jgi:hypothetical protein